MIQKLTNWWKSVRFSASPDDDFWYSPVMRASVAGLPTVSPAAAASCIPVNVCVRAIADTVATLPLHVYRRTEGGKELATNHPNYTLLHNAVSDELTSVEWLTTVMEDVLTYGFHLSRVMLRSKEYVREIIPIPPSEIKINRDKNTGIRFFEWRPAGQAQPIILFDSDVLYVPGPWTKNGQPQSPLVLCEEAISLTMAAQQYASRFFAQGAGLRMYGSMPNVLGEKNRENLHEYINKKVGGLRNAHKVPVFDSGLELKSIPVNHRDIQFLELRKFQLEEVCRVYRVPLHLAGSLDRATFSNIEHQDIEFAKHCIRPWLVRLERRINQTLFGPQEGRTYFAEFSMDALYRGDAKSRAEFYASGVQNAWITPNEVRAKENLNPMEGGDRLLVQGATVPLEQAGMQQEVGNA